MLQIKSKLIKKHLRQLEVDVMKLPAKCKTPEQIENEKFSTSLNLNNSLPKLKKCFTVKKVTKRLNG